MLFLRGLIIQVIMKSFSTPPVAFSVANIDDATGVLQKVIVAQSGKVKSYFEEIDSETLAQIVRLGNEKENGIKARFGHPNMCSSSFGTYIGRFKNFQVHNDSVVADLHLDEIIEYTLVSSEEADTELGKISVRSPVGRALIGKGDRRMA